MGAEVSGAGSMWDLVERRAAATPDALALVDEHDRRLTFGELRRRAEETAAGLQAVGVGPGTVVSWQLPTRIETVLVSLGLARLGAVQNPIIHLYREREVGFALHQTGAAFYLCPGTFKGTDFAAMGRALADGLPARPQVLTVPDDLPAGEPASLPPAPDPGSADDVRWIYYTSGTTAEPKGVRHTDRTLIEGGVGLADALSMSPGDIGSMAFPFAHIAGPDYLVMLLVLGFPAVLLEQFVASEAAAVLRRHRATVAGGSTAFYMAYLAEQRKQPGEPLIPTLRVLAGGGAPMPPEVFHEVAREMGVRVTHGYGMTEVPMIAMGRLSDTDEQLSCTVGRPVLGAEVRIVGPDDAPLPPGTDGEVRVRGPMVCKGYTDPALTAEAFDGEGFFRTGDVGHLRADGHLVLTGRLKDIIIRKGENISAKEIEDLLYQHPKVGDVAVIGLPDRERGEMVCAVVEAAVGAEALGFDEMVSYLRASGLMAQKIPERLEVVDALPRNETLQKVRKDELRRRFG